MTLHGADAARWTVDQRDGRANHAVSRDLSVTVDVGPGGKGEVQIRRSAAGPARVLRVRADSSIRAETLDGPSQHFTLGPREHLVIPAHPAAEAELFDMVNGIEDLAASDRSALLAALTSPTPDEAGPRDLEILPERPPRRRWPALAAILGLLVGVALWQYWPSTPPPPPPLRPAEPRTFTLPEEEPPPPPRPSGALDRAWVAVLDRVTAGAGPLRELSIGHFEHPPRCATGAAGLAPRQVFGASFAGWMAWRSDCGVPNARLRPAVVGLLKLTAWRTADLAPSLSRFSLAASEGDLARRARRQTPTDLRLYVDGWPFLAAGFANHGLAPLLGLAFCAAEFRQAPSLLPIDHRITRRELLLDDRDCSEHRGFDASNAATANLEELASWIDQLPSG